MIFVKFDGRLGNNFFQLAAGLNLSYKHNNELLVPERDFFKFINLKPKHYGVLPDVYEFKEPSFHYSDIKYKDDIILSGYFQSSKYFEENRDAVIRDLSLKEVYMSQIKEKYKDFLTKETISLHVRRTDYLHLSHAHPVLELEYYRNALEHIGTKNKTVVIFSDDIQWCKEAFLGTKFVFIEKNLDIVDMFLMSLCTHNIIANSSFSWWGAFFNKNKDKKVVAPSNWFGSYYKNDTKDLYCPGWEVI